MPGIVGAFLAAADAVAQIGIAGQLSAVSLRAAKDEAKQYAAAVEEAKHVTAGISNESDDDTVGAGSLAAEIKAQTGRR